MYLQLKKNPVRSPFCVQANIGQSERINGVYNWLTCSFLSFSSSALNKNTIQIIIRVNQYLRFLLSLVRAQIPTLPPHKTVIYSINDLRILTQNY